MSLQDELDAAWPKFGETADAPRRVRRFQDRRLRRTAPPAIGTRGDRRGASFVRFTATQNHVVRSTQ
jgi:hypothetical protein